MMPKWKGKHLGVEKMNVAVMGCVVNGPGESRHANIGISLPGDGEAPVAAVFEDGKKTATLRGDNITETFKRMIIDYVNSHYPVEKEDNLVEYFDEMFEDYGSEF